MSQQIVSTPTASSINKRINTVFGGGHQTDFQWTNGDISGLKRHPLHSCIDEVPIRSPACDVGHHSWKEIGLMSASRDAHSWPVVWGTLRVPLLRFLVIERGGCQIDLRT